jgi:hypothetical protein
VQPRERCFLGFVLREGWFGDLFGALWGKCMCVVRGFVRSRQMLVFKVEVLGLVVTCRDILLSGSWMNYTSLTKTPLIIL